MQETLEPMLHNKGSRRSQKPTRPNQRETAALQENLPDIKNLLLGPPWSLETLHNQKEIQL